MKKEFLVLMIFFLMIAPVSGFAQSQQNFDPLKDDISNHIPPLYVLIDSALTTNPMVKYRDMQLILNDCKLKASRYEWTRNIGVQADLRYGNFYNYTANSTGGVDPPAVATSRAETKYGAALFVNMPFYTVVSRRNQIKMAQTEIEQAQYMADAQRNETRQLVIKQYNDLILSQRLLRIKARNFETARINMQMVDKEFSNGVVAVTEYSRITEIFSRSESDFETARSEFLTAYMVLQEIVGINFNLTNQTPGTDDGN
jgi:outer membrane protein TolC